MENIIQSPPENVIYTDEVVFDGQTEQGVELDYVLPDYYPEIFKILKCTLTPRIISYSTSGDSKLTLDGVVYIKVLYLAEGSSAVHCVDQRYTYSKTVDMGRKLPSAAPTVSLALKPDYCNCRAVSSRRIDVRGAVSCKIKAVCPTKYVLPALPDDIQIRTSEITCCGETLTAEKQITVREEIETGASGIGFIVQNDAVAKITDLRVIADKAVVKGTVTLNALYGVHNPESSGCTDMERMSADIPVSVILDVNGITDSHLCLPELTIMNLELAPKTEGGIISCEMLVQCRIRAQREEKIVIPTDMYSTRYESDFVTSSLKIGKNPRVLSQQLSLRSSLSCDSGEIRSVWDCRSELGNLICRVKSDRELTLSGQICWQAVGMTADNSPYFIEKQEPFEQTIPAAELTDETSVDFGAAVIDTGFSIRPDGSLDLTAQLDFSGNLRNITPVEAISAVTVYEDRPKERSDEYALRIYYSCGSLDCWSVAKRYNTTVEAIMRENEIEDENAPLSGMVLIPTV